MKSRSIIRSLGPVMLGGALLFVALAVAAGAEDATPEAEVGSKASRGEKPVTGIGERSLIIVVGAEFDTEDEAREAAGAIAFGEMQGFYVDRTDNYVPLGSYRKVSPDVVFRLDDEGRLERSMAPVVLRYMDRPAPLTPGRWMLVSAFRTLRGAEEFMEVARAASEQTGLVAMRVRKVGGGFVGLGQEPHPDGSGPLLEPLPDPEEFQT